MSFRAIARNLMKLTAPKVKISPFGRNDTSVVVIANAVKQSVSREKDSHVVITPRYDVY
ncbi:hypothetical protein DFQ07_1764 [Tenacibaculum caenipelagi]|uniref:Uncharacterized protein n=1 Tax=Tenacibaculum caenipelagi TaxID=1325435 RepID=A0A4R6TDT1_9FLAO|nr:hypothetical protein DFQ07_1764 [Tenacibaculum caenipelagi]